MLIKMVTHIEKVKSDSLLGRHRCWSDADVVERLAVRGHPDGEGEVLREARLCCQLEGQGDDGGHVTPFPITSEHDFGEDLSGEVGPVESEAHRGGLGGQSRFHHPVNLLRTPFDHVGDVGALEDLVRGHEHGQTHL